MQPQLDIRFITSVPLNFNEVSIKNNGGFYQSEKKPGTMAIYGPAEKVYAMTELLSKEIKEYLI